MAIHTLTPARATLHGQFSREFAPALTIEPGDTVRYSTLDVAWGMEQHGAPGLPRRKFEPRQSPRDDGPALCGPVALRGAQPGMTLAIHIEHLTPASWGWTHAAPHSFNRALSAALGIAEAAPVLLRWQLNAETLTGMSEHGQRVPLRPFLGIIGLPPEALGLHSGWTPRLTGGNLDCRELIAGSVLFLPVAVPGALVSIGDGHAAQGDGEVGGTAIECRMERVDLRFELRPDLVVSSPRALTPAGRVTLGFGATLDDAAAMALNAMLDWMSAEHGLSRMEALALASVAVDVRVTQVVNGVVGAHAVLPRDRLAVH